MGHSVVASSWLCATIRALTKRVQVLEQELRVQRASEFVPSNFPARPPGDFLSGADEFLSCSEDRVMDEDEHTAVVLMQTDADVFSVPKTELEVMNREMDKTEQVVIKKHSIWLLGDHTIDKCEVRPWEFFASSSSSNPPIASSFVYGLSLFETHVFTNAVDDPDFFGKDFQFDKLEIEYHCSCPTASVFDDEPEMEFAELCGRLRCFGLAGQFFYDENPECVGKFSFMKPYSFCLEEVSSDEEGLTSSDDGDPYFIDNEELREQYEEELAEQCLRAQCGDEAFEEMTYS